MANILSALKGVPPKIWLFLAGIIVGVPTSIYGAQWFGFKIIKQDANCFSDLYIGLAEQPAADPQHQLDQIQGQLDGYTSCIRSVDPNMGTIKFIQAEIERSSNGR